MATPILWQFAISHYAEKARWALDYKCVPHIRRSLFPGPHIARMKRLSGQTAVPVLELDGRIIFDSTRILQALDQAYPATPLYPSDPAERERAVMLEGFFDEELGGYLRQWAYFILLPHTTAVTAMFAGNSTASQRLFLRVMFPAVRPLMRRAMRVYPAPAEAARVKTIAAMDRIARETGRSGHMVGDRFTAADLTAAALLSPLVIPEERPYKIQVKLPVEFIEARERLSEHPAFKWAAEMYARHRGTSSAIAEETVI